ncbi:uncharacterized protein LOC128990146 [Macrosteles quadrilineatus]|uniref:uncharacterized protein LOC128990146 n=1 Tax=Macrosteles quadrilineatus TaxID=74068 RepID=UPI0023E09BB1|nr:uncharacterized protein LOC128990146 [Macrosteles quadrilineatus]XP_054268386.1 uncharacterized protein LOC128990146 [Macrosteles quadrilineatus]
MELREPKRKRVGGHIKPQQPFPIIIESESGISVDSELHFPLYVGNFTGDCVVCNPEEARSLYTMGFFGKGSFSRGYPSFGLTTKGIPPIIKERQWKRRKGWMESMKNNVVKTLQLQRDESVKNNSETVQNNQDVDDEDTNKIEAANSQNSVDNVSENQLVLNSGDQAHNLNSKVLVLTDSDDEDLEKVIRNPNPHLEDEPFKTSAETLNLTLEEAFFLSYALGCLHVYDISGQLLKLNHLWQTFCETRSDFIEMYVSYHYFRAKGWVVKTGYKFGGDFLLYKQGPAFYHASFIVLVEKVNTKLERQNESLTWTKLHGLNRLSEGSGKDVIVCQVVFPDDLTSEDLKTPKSLPMFQVNELLIKRWISSQEREDKEVILNDV